MTSPLAYIYDRNSIMSSTLAPAQPENTRVYNTAAATGSTNPVSPAATISAPQQQQQQNSLASNVERLNAMLELHMLALQDIDQRLKAIVEKTNAQEAKQDLLWQRISLQNQAQVSNQNKPSDTILPSPVVQMSTTPSSSTQIPENYSSSCFTGNTGATAWQIALIVLGTLILILLIWLIASKARESWLDRTSTAVVQKMQVSLGRMVDDAVSRSVRAAIPKGNESTTQSRPYYGSFFQGPSTPQ